MFIYKITNNVNGKIYIGQTTQNIKKRWKGHLSKNSFCSYLKYAIQKYGSDNFIIEEIDGANSMAELNYKEWLYIHKFNTLAPYGYNLKEGGRGFGKHGEITRSKMSKSQKGIKKPKSAKQARKLAKERIGTKQSEEHKRKKAKSVCKKIVDRTTGVIYNSIKEAALAIDAKRPNISTNLKGKNNSVKGSVFCYFEGWDGLLTKKRRVGKGKKSKEVLCLNDKKIYISTLEAAKQLNLNPNSVRACSNGNIKQIKGYKFKYV